MDVGVRYDEMPSLGVFTKEYIDHVCDTRGVKSECTLSGFVDIV